MPNLSVSPLGRHRRPPVVHYREGGDKSLMEEFFNSSEEIVQRSEFKRSENEIHMQPKQRPVDRPVDRHASLVHGSSSVDARAKFLLRVSRPFGRPTEMSPASVGVRSTDRSTEAVDR